MPSIRPMTKAKGWFTKMAENTSPMPADTRLVQKPKNEDILFFMPKSEESHRRILLAYRHSSESNPLVRAFVSLAKKSFR